MNRNRVPFQHFGMELSYQTNEFASVSGNAAIGDGKRPKFDTLVRTEGALSSQIKLPHFMGLKQRDDRVNASIAPTHDFV